MSGLKNISWSKVIYYWLYKKRANSKKVPLHMLSQWPSVPWKDDSSCLAGWLPQRRLIYERVTQQRMIYGFHKYKWFTEPFAFMSGSFLRQKPPLKWEQPRAAYKQWIALLYPSACVSVCMSFYVFVCVNMCLLVFSPCLHACNQLISSMTWFPFWSVLYTCQELSRDLPQIAVSRHAKSGELY